MDKSDIFIWTVVVIAMIAVVVTIVWWAIEISTAPEIIYLLPDGVTCERSFMTGHMGKATHEFSRCSDGYIHINPEKYRRVIKR